MRDMTGRSWLNCKHGWRDGFARRREAEVNQPFLRPRKNGGFRFALWTIRREVESFFERFDSAKG